MQCNLLMLSLICQAGQEGQEQSPNQREACGQHALRGWGRPHHHHGPPRQSDPGDGYHGGADDDDVAVDADDVVPPHL